MQGDKCKNKTFFNINLVSYYTIIDTKIDEKYAESQIVTR